MSEKERDETEEFENMAEGKEKYLLRLYVTGMTPRSVLAIENIRRICEERLKGRYERAREPTPHRCADQRKNTDVRLNVGSAKSPKRPWVPNFVRADACFLPFRAGSVRKAFSSHVIEHLPDPLAFLRELCRLAAGKIEVHCPNGEFKSCRDELRPLHLWDFSAGWFREHLQAFQDWDFLVRWDYSQSEPWELVVEGYRVNAEEAAAG